MMEYARIHRNRYQLSGDQYLYMGVSWIIDPERRCLDLFPEFIHIDGTININDEKVNCLLWRENADLVTCLHFYVHFYQKPKYGIFNSDFEFYFHRLCQEKTAAHQYNNM